MNDIFLDGWRIYLAGEVKVEAFAFPSIYFQVFDYHVKFNIKKYEFSPCTCVYGSMYGINKEQQCRHVIACREWIKDKLQDYLKERRA